MSKFDSRARCRFAPRRRRRAFGPRRTSPFVKIKHYIKHFRGSIGMDFGRVEEVRFVTSPIRPLGKSHFANMQVWIDEFKFYEDTTADEHAAGLRALGERIDRGVYDILTRKPPV